MTVSTRIKEVKVGMNTEIEEISTKIDQVLKRFAFASLEPPEPEEYDDEDEEDDDLEEDE